MKTRNFYFLLACIFLIAPTTFGWPVPNSGRSGFDLFLEHSGYEILSKINLHGHPGEHLRFRDGTADWIAACDDSKHEEQKVGDGSSVRKFAEVCRIFSTSGAKELASFSRSKWDLFEGHFLAISKNRVLYVYTAASIRKDIPQSLITSFLDIDIDTGKVTESPLTNWPKGILKPPLPEIDHHNGFLASAKNMRSFGGVAAILEIIDGSIHLALTTGENFDLKISREKYPPETYIDEFAFNEDFYYVHFMKSAWIDGPVLINRKTGAVFNEALRDGRFGQYVDRNVVAADEFSVVKNSVEIGWSGKPTTTIYNFSRGTETYFDRISFLGKNSSGLYLGQKVKITPYDRYTDFSDNGFIIGDESAVVYDDERECKSFCVTGGVTLVI